jgi:hypothetical protein
VYYGFSDLALGITMASIGRSVFFAPILVAAVPGFSALAQEAAPVPRAPMTYGTDVRADNPHAPTPQFAPLAPGVYAREILNTKSSKGDYVVQIWSLLVSPKSSTNEVRLPGAAMLSLNAGRIEIITGNSRSTLGPGGTVAVKEGASLRFVNSDASRPAQLRAIILSGSR